MTKRENQRLFTFEQAKEYLNGREKKKLYHHTYMIDRGDHISIRYHRTDIVDIFLNNTYYANNGGWQTPTTKERLSGHLPVYVHSNRGEWIVNQPNGESYPFTNGMVFNDHGVLIQEEF